MNNSIKGFTLIELIIVIVIGGILATMISTMIARPIEGFVAVSRRAELVDMAENSLRRMQRDIRSALPNSVRVGGGGQVIEMINVRNAGRYREGMGTGTPGNSDPACWLNFDDINGDDSFGILTGLTAGGFSGNNRIVISNWNNSGAIANAYLGDAGDNISPSTSSISLQSPDGTCSEPYLTLSAPFQFQHRSPRQRFYLIDTPIAYVCDIGAGTLTRYRNYALSENQANVDSAAELLAAGAQADPVAIHLTSCNFTYVSTTNTGQRSGLATLTLQLTNEGERIQLLHQVQVNNLP